jgi:hypothetical protein
MEKVQRGAQHATPNEAPADFHDKLAQAIEVEELMNLWEQAKVGGYADFVRKSISERKAIITGGKK